VLLVVLFVFHAQGDKALGFLDRLLRVFPAWVAQPLRGILGAFAGGLAVLKAPLPELLAIAAQSVLVWLSIALGLHLNNRAFAIDLPFHSTFLIIAFLTVGVAIPTPGMVGGFHGFFIVALADAFGADRGTAGAAAITAHALSNLPVLGLGLLFLGREGLSLARVAEISEKQSAGHAPATGRVEP
jgi:glycosyltransferase 2 family protein